VPRRLRRARRLLVHQLVVARGAVVLVAGCRTSTYLQRPPLRVRLRPERATIPLHSSWSGCAGSGLLRHDHARRRTPPRCRHVPGAEIAESSSVPRGSQIAFVVPSRAWILRLDLSRDQSGLARGQLDRLRQQDVPSPSTWIAPPSFTAGRCTCPPPGPPRTRRSRVVLQRATPAAPHPLTSSHQRRVRAIGTNVARSRITRRRVHARQLDVRGRAAPGALPPAPGRPPSYRLVRTDARATVATPPALREVSALSRWGRSGQAIQVRSCGAHVAGIRQANS